VLQPFKQLQSTAFIENLQLSFSAQNYLIYITPPQPPPPIHLYSGQKQKQRQKERDQSINWIMTTRKEKGREASVGS
jgi:hypothetical protein